MRGTKWISGVVAVFLLAAAVAAQTTAPQRLRVEVVAVRQHDPEAFTQGLLLHNGLLYESTGLYGRSSIRAYDPVSGSLVRIETLPTALFGEGLAFGGDRLVQLTWREGVALERDPKTLAERTRRRYAGEGWGLAHDGKRFIMTDGSAQLFFRDTKTFDLLSTLTVLRRGVPQDRLNELEWAEGQLFANVLGEENILRIDTESGIVTAEIDCSGLLAPGERARADVLNGIAHDPATGHFLITGKLWPKLFEVKFVPVSP
ncbi:MAG: glutaminyl-peptide cyclotransferase [Candidatus Sumerlaeaceae bacterium]|nr:glutaminyl-peptide cyclotransferase [Candidatus Sumerlaeaceae bacterium]